MRLTFVKLLLHDPFQKYKRVGGLTWKRDLLFVEEVPDRTITIKQDSAIPILKIDKTLNGLI